MKFRILFLLVIVFGSYTLAQEANTKDNRIVASAGTYKITAEEFKDRYEFSPHPRTINSLDTTLIKREYLYTLIAEKLLAEKAKSLGLDTAKDVSVQLSHMRDLFVRDALYHKVVSDKVKITPKEISKAEKRYSKTLLVKYLYSTNKKEIDELYSGLKDGASIDFLLVGRPEAAEQNPLGKVTYGSLDEYLEDSLYNLKPGEFTTPIYAGGRWYIFKLYKIVTEPFFTTPENLIKLKKVIGKNQTNKLEENYLFSFLRKFNIDVDRQLFLRILGEIKEIVNARYAEDKKSGSSQTLYLLADDINRVKDSLGDEVLNSNFVKFEVNPITVREFLNKLRYNNIKIDTSNVNSVGYIFNTIVKNFIESELLTREGYKVGLGSSDLVKNDMSVWDTYYPSQKLEQVIFDSISISDEEAYEFYNKNHNEIYKPDRIDLEEIIVTDLDMISEILKDINKGLSFNDAAQKYCIVDSIRQRGGQLGYLPVNKLGELGQIAEKMKRNEVYGPVKVPQGYALIKLIDIEQHDKPEDTSFVKNKNEIIEIMKKIKLEQKLKDYVADLAVKYSVSINENVFDSIPVLMMNDVTVRLIGFGGRILAFPYSPLFANWYNVYLSEKKNLVQ